MPKGSVKFVTDELRKIAPSPFSTDDEGNVISHARQLANLLWVYALGGEVKKVMDDGIVRKVYINPEEWAIRTILDRLEGKPISITDDMEVSIIARENIDNILKNKINQMAKDTAAN